MLGPGSQPFHREGPGALQLQFGWQLLQSQPAACTCSKGLSEGALGAPCASRTASAIEWRAQPALIQTRGCCRLCVMQGQTREVWA